MAESHSGSENNHASVKLYLVFAVILCVLTFLEWAVFKSESLRSKTMFIVPVLAAMSIAKFAMVCGWYMHLRYDPSILRRVFAFAAFLASLIFFILHLALR